jgi:hypothetical protein
MRVSTSFITLAIAIGTFAAPVSEDAAVSDLHPLPLSMY